MSETHSNADLARLSADLARSLRDLQRELEPGGRRGPPLPRPRDLLRFTDEVAIPAAILLLETNIRALKLLQRAIRIAEGRDTTTKAASREAGEVVRDRAIAVSQTTLSRLDDLLADLQDAVAGRPDDDRARAVLDEARSLRGELDEQLAAAEASADAV
jgi:hypothetical protein